MILRRVSTILPCNNWDDFPTYLEGSAAAELLSAWTAAWHPALIAATQHIPGWHPSDEPPDPGSLDGELILVPPPSRVRMPGDWCERMRATAPANPAPVETSASRAETIASILASVGVDATSVDSEAAADFFALGFAYLQVELLTRAMRYSSVLDTTQFETAVVAAAKAAMEVNQQVSRDEFGRAFDLLADARNHVYSVDFYVVDITLAADSTLGDSLREKLAAGAPTNLLVTGAQIEQMANDHPETFAALKHSVDAGTASIVGGFYRSGAGGAQSPEAMLENLKRGQEAARQYLNCDFEIFGQFDAAFTHLLPEVLKSLSFRGALHVAFDGNQLPRANQRKTFWGGSPATSLEALSATPLDVSRPETWLKFAERVGDSIAHDHVATLLLAGWPNSQSESFDDLRRASRFGTVLGKLITLNEYFGVTREPDEWTTFFPREYPNRMPSGDGSNPISQSIDAYRDDVVNNHRVAAAGLAAVAGIPLAGGSHSAAQSLVAINPWSFECSQVMGVDPLALEETRGEIAKPRTALLPEILGCGYLAVGAAAAASPIALAEDLTLRNELFELNISPKTGGIQSLRTHRDRATRVSQRLVFHNQTGDSINESQMVADQVSVSRNDELVGEITATGRVLDGRKEVLARFTQQTRVARGLAPVIIDVELVPQQMPSGDLWRSYFASRLAWADDSLTVRFGEQWTARETEREQIVSPEWIDIDELSGRITCYALGLPYHRRAASNWLDTLLIAEGETRRRFQFAIGVDQPYPTRAAIAALTAGHPTLAELPGAERAPRGWFLHLPAKNTLLTCVEPLVEPATGVRLRILETEGRETRTMLAGFRPFRAARTTDFRGNAIEVLSVSHGSVQFDIGPYGWIQIEAEWEQG
jgi:alpha-mannosidase